MPAKRKTMLPGEPNPNSPDVPGKDGSPNPRYTPGRPMPVKSYGKLKKAFATPGMQPGERDAIANIAKRRGVTAAEARKIGRMRTSKGLTTAGVAGPKGVSLKDDIKRGKTAPLKPIAIKDPRSAFGPKRPPKMPKRPTAVEYK